MFFVNRNIGYPKPAHHWPDRNFPKYYPTSNPSISEQLTTKTPNGQPSVTSKWKRLQTRLPANESTVTRIARAVKSTQDCRAPRAMEGSRNNRTVRVVCVIVTVKVTYAILTRENVSTVSRIVLVNFFLLFCIFQPFFFLSSSVYQFSALPSLLLFQFMRFLASPFLLLQFFI